MEKITKKISLSCFSKDAESGDYTPDFVLDSADVDEDILSIVPSIEVYDEEEGAYKYLMRRRNVEDFFQWLIHFMMNHEVYRLCMRNGDVRWALVGYTEEEEACGEGVKDIVRFNDLSLSAETGFYVVEALPSFTVEDLESGDTSGYTYGTYAIPSEYAVEFEKRFGTTEYATEFYCFATSLLGKTNECDSCEDVPYGTSVPYASVKLHLEESIEDMGDLYPVTALNFCGDYDSSKDYELYSVALFESGGTKVIKVCNLNCFGEKEWFEIGDGVWCEPFNDSVTTADTTVKARTESSVKTLMRRRRACDLHGVELPFFVDVDGEEGTRGGDTELLYNVGSVVNVMESEGGFYYDRLEKEPEYLDDELEPASKDMGRYVRFTYTKGNYYGSDGEGNAYDNPGLTCVEIYPYECKVGHFSVYTEAGEDYTYIDIDYDNPYSPDNTFYRSGEYAEVEYEPGRILPDFANDNVLIRHEGTLGMHDVGRKGDRIHIDRGRSAFFEPFNILGEVNSVEDIENYRDDYFRIRGKND